MMKQCESRWQKTVIFKRKYFRANFDIEKSLLFRDFTTSTTELSVELMHKEKANDGVQTRTQQNCAADFLLAQARAR